MSANLPGTGYHFFQGGGEMGQLIRSKDWSATIGNPDDWPDCLKIATSIMLSTPFPMYIAWGKEYIQLYNDGYRPILGTTKHPQALGLSTKETFSEVWYIIGSMFDGVMQGEAIGFPNFMLPLDRNGYVEECYFDFSYSPIRYKNGEIGGVLVTVIEVTEKLRALEANKAQTIALQNSESKFRKLIEQAPVAISNLVGRELVIESANEKMLSLWGKSAEIIGKQLSIALPELEGQPFLKILDDIFVTGEPFIANEAKATLNHGGKLKDGYYNFIYQPIINEEGQTTAIAVVGTEVTTHVEARNELISAYEQLRLSKETADLGTFDMDLIEGTMEWDARCRELFGISHTNKVTYEDDFLPGLHVDDKDRVEKLIADLFIKEKSNGDYDVEYRTVGVEDGKERWVKAKGKVFFSENDAPYRFIGSVVEITNYKEDEQRKNDFIGIVSHELKTPLTSLKAYVQVLNVKAQKQNDEFSREALTKVERQVNKMSAMVNGFLNVSRLEAGKMQLHLSQFLIDDLIKEVVEETKIVASNHNISFSPCNPISITADKDKIAHVLSNILSNALKYSPKGKLIAVDCIIEGDWIVVSVKDEGMGIKAEDIDKLFDRYYRVASKHTQHISGFGIGLYLSAELIQLHGGKIWVESKSGVGSTLFFKLPVTISS